MLYHTLFSFKDSRRNKHLGTSLFSSLEFNFLQFEPQTKQNKEKEVT
jgi:hypothetical protein